MWVNLEQFERGAMTFYETEIAQQANGIGKFAAYFVMPTLPQVIRDNVAKFRSTPFLTGVINQDGLIDIDTARQRADTAMEKCGNIEIMGFRLNRDDINKLYDAIARS